MNLLCFNLLRSINFIASQTAGRRWQKITRDAGAAFYLRHGEIEYVSRVVLQYWISEDDDTIGSKPLPPPRRTSCVCRPVALDAKYKAASASVAAAAGWSLALRSVYAPWISLHDLFVCSPRPIDHT